MTMYFLKNKQSLFWKILLILLCYPHILYAQESYEKVNLLNPLAVEGFYAEREGEPLWVSDARLNNQAEILLSTLRDSWKQGLNPETYHVSQIESVIGSSLSDDDVMAVELMLTDGYVRYARDMSGIRIKASDLDLNPKDWRKMPSVPWVLTQLKSQNVEIKDLLESLEPKAKTYQTLKAELVRLVQDSKDEDDPPPLKFNGLVMPGKGYGDIPKLRARFSLEEVLQNEQYTYDDNLAAAVMAFQSERGLKADGIIGERTLHALNITRKDKIRQLIVNLERLRWIPEEKPKRFIVVNIPSAMLWAIDDGSVKQEMPVIVGRPERETPSFVTHIHGVRFNPTWTVPPTVKQEDILPKLREDSGYLLDKGMELFEGQGPDAVTIDPTTVDWNAATDADLKKMHMVQMAGANNPLGTIRVLMPNSQNIYLHDTNHHSMFNKYDRALSSGCIRMKYPEKIADFILSFRKAWKVENIQSLIKSGKTKDIYVDENMPVYLLYYTAWVDEKGRVVFGMDIYNRDKKLLQFLEKLDGFVI